MNKPNQTSPPARSPPPRQCLGMRSGGPARVGCLDWPYTFAVGTRRIDLLQGRGEGGVWILRYISSMDWRKCGKFIMKVASDVLLLLCLHDFGLWVSVGLGQATAFLYSEARLYKGPRQSPLPQLTATRSTGNISVRTESQPQQHTWTSEFFVLFPLKKNHCCT